MPYVGSVVRSVSGRDKKRLFVICGICDDGSGCVTVADGHLRKISSPKKKNLRHLAVLAIADEDKTSILEDDERLYNYLREFEKNLKNAKSSH